MQPIIVDGFIPTEVAKDLNSFLRPLVTANPQGVLSKQLHVPWEKNLIILFMKLTKRLMHF